MPVKSAKKMTTPWNSSSNPWSLDLLRLRKKHKGFEPRFVDKSQVQKRLEQGYMFANLKDYGGLSDKLPGEEGEIDTAVRRRELVLMELPESLHRAKVEFLKNKTDRRSIDARQIVKSESAKIEETLGSSVQYEEAG